MPMYDYRCRDCDHEFEVHQAFSDDPLTECPECGGNLRKVFSPVGISFKGSGFYKTDSQGGSSATRPSTSGDKSGDKGSDTGSSDSSTKSDSSSSSDSGSSSPGKDKGSSSGKDKGSSTTSAA